MKSKFELKMKPIRQTPSKRKPKGFKLTSNPNYKTPKSNLQSQTSNKSKPTRPSLVKSIKNSPTKHKLNNKFQLANVQTSKFEIDLAPRLSLPKAKAKSILTNPSKKAPTTSVQSADKLEKPPTPGTIKSRSSSGSSGSSGSNGSSGSRKRKSKNKSQLMKNLNMHYMEMIKLVKAAIAGTAESRRLQLMRHHDAELTKMIKDIQQLTGVSDERWKRAVRVIRSLRRFISRLFTAADKKIANVNDEMNKHLDLFAELKDETDPEKNAARIKSPLPDDGPTKKPLN